MTAEAFAARLDALMERDRQVFIAKNQGYGDSALNPVRIFSSADTTEQLKVRLDDKLSRIVRGGNIDSELLMDIRGYLYLLEMKLEN